MRKVRKQPWGYHMEKGKCTPQKVDEDVDCELFDVYRDRSAQKGGKNVVCEERFEPEDRLRCYSEKFDMQMRRIATCGEGVSGSST